MFSGCSSHVKQETSDNLTQKFDKTSFWRNAENWTQKFENSVIIFCELKKASETGSTSPVC